MAIPKDKQDLLNSINENYQKLIKEFADISIELTDKMDLEGHSKNTLMSINNLIAYLIGWGQLVLKWNTLKDNGMDVDFPETGFKWNQLGQLAQKFYKDYENEDYKTLQEKLDLTVKDILEMVGNKTNYELYGIPWHDKYTLGRMIQFNSSSPYKNAKERIRKWKKLGAKNASH